MRRIPALALLLPGEQCLYVSDGIQNPLRPMLILRVHDNNAKTVIMAFRAHTFGVIDMQVDIEGRGNFDGPFDSPFVANAWLCTTLLTTPSTRMPYNNSQRLI